MSRPAPTALRLLLPALVLLLASCSPPELRPDLSVPPGPDGLVPLLGAGLGDAAIRPGTNLARYKRLRLEPVEFEFRPVDPVTPANRSTATEFPLSETEREQLVADVTRVIREQLAGSRHLLMTSASGPDVLVVKVALLDIVSNMPPDLQIAARSEVYVDRFGESTLTLQLLDDESNQLLARTADRRTAETPDSFGDPGSLEYRGPLSRATRVQARVETERLARRWGDRVRRRIDQLYVQGKIGESVGSPPVAPAEQ
jgi:hypothetical protein